VELHHRAAPKAMLKDVEAVILAQALSWFQSFVAKIDSLTDAVSTSIAKTAEYRSALITAAVTGQIGELK
jgi:hypothetical protein